MYVHGDLTFFTQRHEEHALIESQIAQFASSNKAVTILEAGCGRRWPFNLNGFHCHITGVDTDAIALNDRKRQFEDLDEVVLGDLSQLEMPDNQFDVIYSAFVLEHVKQADLVLEKFVKWAKPGAVIILKVPDSNAVYGFLARITPYWVHVLFYRYLLGSKHAGKPGYCPYPTHYHNSISRQGIRKFCATREQKIRLDGEYADAYKRESRGFRQWIIHCVKKLTRILSLGRLADSHANIVFILRKTQSEL